MFCLLVLQFILLLACSSEIQIWSVWRGYSGILLTDLVVRIVVLALLALLTLLSLKIEKRVIGRTRKALVVVFVWSLDGAVLYLCVLVLVPQLLDALVEFS